MSRAAKLPTIPTGAVLYFALIAMSNIVAQLWLVNHTTVGHLMLRNMPELAADVMKDPCGNMGYDCYERSTQLDHAL